MVWLYRLLSQWGGGGILLVQMISTCLRRAFKRGGDQHPVGALTHRAEKILESMKKGTAEYSIYSRDTNHKTKDFRDCAILPIYFSN